MKKWFLILVLIFSMILSACGILPNGEGDDDMAVIDIGSPAIDRPTYSVAQKTRVDKSNPANASGVITTVEIWAETDLTDVEVAIFYVVSGDNLSTRSTAYIGNVTAGAKRTFTVSLAVEKGDFIGMYYSSGRMEAEKGEAGSSYYKDGDHIPCTNQTFTVGSTLYSIHGIGTTIPTVTTQAVSDITYNSGKGNGEITATGGENATERGFEYKQGATGTIIKTYDTGSFGTGTFNKVITGLSPNTLYYVRAYAKNSAGIGYGDWESFTTDKTIPTIVTNAVTEIDTDSATANGNITATGGEDCSERGFQYGLTKVATWTVKDTVGGYGTGVYSKALTSLSPNTIYWIRAYAVNSIGTSYGDWVEFQTAVTGATPTNTRITLTGDVSGYVAQMHDSENDLDYPYEGYFVLATDLSETNTLIFYKRLLDLDSYFRKETSGSVTISIKCDHENDWHKIGDVDLTGDNDIVLKHLAPDNLGKHFQVKFSGKNAFRYLGTIFAFVVQGER